MPPPCSGVEAATLAPNGSPPITRITFPTCRAHYPAGSSGCSCRLLPRSRSLPQMAGGSASALSLSRPAQALLTLRPAGSLSRPKATFVTRLQPMRLPAQAARQLPDQSTTLRVGSSSTGDSRLRGALPIPDLSRCSKLSASLLDHLVGDGEQCWQHREAECLRCLQIDSQLKLRRLLNEPAYFVRTGATAS